MTQQMIASVLGCSVDQLRRQYLTNAQQLRQLARRAGSGVYRGHTASYWTAKAVEFEAKAKHEN